eukprot:COSAG01_NODE_3441_length_6094_cov_16.295079_1_plen_32_part_10
MELDKAVRPSTTSNAASSSHLGVHITIFEYGW